MNRLRAHNFDRMCPIICLFFTHGLDFKPMKRMKLNAFIWHQSYNKPLVDLSIAYGADYSGFAEDYFEPISQAKAAMKDHHGQLAHHHAQGNTCQDRGDYQGAINAYEAAIELAQQCYDEAAELLAAQSEKEIPFPEKMHPHIVQAYTELSTQLDQKAQACREKLADISPMPAKTK